MGKGQGGGGGGGGETYPLPPPPPPLPNYPSTFSFNVYVNQYKLNHKYTNLIYETFILFGDISRRILLSTILNFAILQPAKSLHPHPPIFKTFLRLCYCINHSAIHKYNFHDGIFYAFQIINFSA